jgi:Spy/CpxP family protein refolding chaperone
VSRTVAFISVLALFLSGLSIGALGMHLYHERHFSPDLRPDPGGPGAGFFLTMLRRELDLTQAQLEKIAQIHLESRHQSEWIRYEIRPQIESLMEETHEMIREVLTEDQRDRFDELVEEHDRNMGRFLLGEGRPGKLGRGSGPPLEAP